MPLQNSAKMFTWSLLWRKRHHPGGGFCCLEATACVGRGTTRGAAGWV